MAHSTQSQPDSPHPGVGRGRRRVIDVARRRMERALMVADAADELAVAADAVLAAARNGEVEEAQLLALRTALDRYRATGAV